MRTIAAYTLGCKVNQYDTEAMVEAFEAAGYASVPFQAAADVYLINTCTVTSTGDQKSLKMIRRTAREHPGSDIIVAGCLAQRDGEALSELDGVRLVIGSARRARVVELYEEACREDRTAVAVEPLRGAAFEALRVGRHEGKTRAVMKIQEGCDRYCSYCIIPYVRGPVRSMPLAAVREEARRLAESGYAEIVLTGIHLASYGRDSGESLLDAVRAAAETPGVCRVRLGSLEPKWMTRETARILSGIPALARQFHLSLQSGSAGVLRRMRRRYTPEEYAEACENVRAFMPDAAVTTDIIAGFPGETEEEHRETLAFLERTALARLHVFPYSRREGTMADGMPGQVPEAEKKRRAAELIALGNQLELRFVQGCKGTVQTVLFERALDGGLCEGYTGSYVRVRAEGSPGELARVRLTGNEGTLAIGETVAQDGR
ncbi:MAG: tRNA (N(6)-L-threonylcarbamoyladenosine(37)-C(2))-methylthiotransferase MtaB [Clostridia bacterium]|nr:tRNA (N(6)-L-threonylcarbamoyladenosine(37)-C(2))-methylthiotransferase MtaB [Clostridia bacterium]